MDFSLLDQDQIVTGVVEKLFGTYGFIRVCETKPCLYFKSCNIISPNKNLKIGDKVELTVIFNSIYKKYNAVNISKYERANDTRQRGIVFSELGSVSDTGQISQNIKGQHFFLPYKRKDIEGNVTLKNGDAVSFCIATTEQNIFSATNICLFYRGIISLINKNYGYIERSDIVKEIYFEVNSNKFELGDNVEFIIQTRNKYEIACDLSLLPTGSVVLGDVSPDVIRGRVLKSVKNYHVTTPLGEFLPGRIGYCATDKTNKEILFGNKDQPKGETLMPGEWVLFQEVTDYRDNAKRATNIRLLNIVDMPGGKREQGVVISLKSDFGFIKCVEREQDLKFRYDEVFRMEQLSVNDEVEFDVQLFINKLRATWITRLPPGTVKFQNLIERGVRGVIFEEANETNSGLIKCLSPMIVTPKTKKIPYTICGCKFNLIPKMANKVTFDVYMVKSTKELIAMNVLISGTVSRDNNTKNRGYISLIVNDFGVIENLENNDSISFHVSAVQGRPRSLRAGCEVQFVVDRDCERNAELVRILPSGTIRIPKVLNAKFVGNVVRSLRLTNPRQHQYTGLIQAASGTKYEFGLMCLSNIRDIPNVNDPVTFQFNEKGKVINIVLAKEKEHGIIEQILESIGHILLEDDKMTSIPFLVSESRGTPLSQLQNGDPVEFVTEINQATGETVAYNVFKIIPRRAKCPEWLESRKLQRKPIRKDGDGYTLLVMAIREPRKPDGTRGFKPRQPISEILREECHKIQ